MNNIIYDKVKEIIPNVLVLPMICNATKLRQDELNNSLKDIDNETLVIIVGDKSSNNCTKLFELAKRNTDSVLFISSYLELLDLDLNYYNKFIISSGTSTPIINVKEIKDYLIKGKVSKKSTLKDYIK